MAISAQTLFHFTKYNYLKKIIKTKAFYPRYCFEESIDHEGLVLAYPMTCFCDIPLSQIQFYAKTYHSNGLGLKKSWGVESGLNPVFYLQTGSYPLALINKAFRAALSNQTKLSDEKYAINTDNPAFLKYFLHLTAYFKPRAGKTWNKANKRFEVYQQSNKFRMTDFYNEREWRYIPDHTTVNSDLNIPLNFIPGYHFYEGEFFNEKYFSDQNKSLEKYPLTFTASDVKYIIVEKRSYVKYMSDFITKLDESIYTNDEKNILISRIISLTQIKEDF